MVFGCIIFKEGGGIVFFVMNISGGWFWGKIVIWSKK